MGYGGLVAERANGWLGVGDGFKNGDAIFGKAAEAALAGAHYEVLGG